jgi:hypothetical protein
MQNEPTQVVSFQRWFPKTNPVWTGKILNREERRLDGTKVLLEHPDR